MPGSGTGVAVRLAAGAVVGVKTCKAPKSVPSISTTKSASAPVRSVVAYREENPKPSSKKKENWSGSPPAKFSVRSRVKLIVVPRVIGCKSSLKKLPSAMVTGPGRAPVRYTAGAREVRSTEAERPCDPPTRGGERCMCPVPILYTQRAPQALWQKGATCRVQELALPSGLPQERLWG